METSLSGYDSAQRGQRPQKTCIRDAVRLQVFGTQKSPPNVVSMRRLAAIAISVTLCGGWLAAEPQKGKPDPLNLAAKLKTYEAPGYVIYTDVSADEAREAVLRMTKMAEEYRRCTVHIFSTPPDRPPPF